MSLQERICNHQNTSEMLKCQFTARYLFNKTEKYNVALIVFAIFSALCIFIPESTNNVTHSLSLIIPLAFDVFFTICCYKMNRTIGLAAKLRNYFDDTVLEFGFKDKSEDEIRRIRELIISISSKNRVKCETQIANTSRDNPPGVKNWYEFSNDLSDKEVVFECQKQNQWWSKKMIQSRMMYNAVVLLIIFGVIIVLFFLQVEVLQVIICFASFIVLCVDRIIENARYIRISMKIDDYCEIMTSSRNQNQIKKLQQLIESRRELPVVGINRWHKKNSKTLSERYERMSNSIK